VLGDVPKDKRCKCHQNERRGEKLSLFEKLFGSRS
jgi:hypothetical protein